MQIQELFYCAVLIAVFYILVTTVPRRWLDLWENFERGLQALARRKNLSCVAAGLLVLGVRAALLPVWPVPQPSVYDEFSYLLQADTFAHGHLTNPPHPLWRFFESTYILQQPTYASRFPPGPALAMALGQVIFGHPWFGIWLSAGLLAAALCWSLQGWLPPGWALLGTFISINLCLFSYWMNSYWGGAVTALGGALVVGAWVRITRAKQWRYAWHFAIGAVIVVLARPFEGLVLLVPSLVTLGRATRSARVWIPIVLAGVMGASWLAYDNYRITGHPLRLPYRQYYLEYETVPPFWFMPSSSPAPGFAEFDLTSRTFDTYKRARSWRLLVDRPLDWLILLATYLGNLAWLFPPAAFAALVWHSRRTRFAMILALIMGAASLLEVWWYPHYGAPLTAVVLILVTQSLRYLRQWRWGQREIGLFLVRAMSVAILVLMVATEARAIAKHQTANELQAKNRLKKKAEEQLLAMHPGKHVIFVRYTEPGPHSEWVYNPAKIDDAPVIWAHDLGQEENERLRRYYADRSFWLFEPDKSMRIVSY